jgi:hypothetical protein
MLLAKRTTVGRHGGKDKGRLAPSGGAVLQLDISVRQKTRRLQGYLSLAPYRTESSKRARYIERIAVIRL